MPRLCPRCYTDEVMKGGKTQGTSATRPCLEKLQDTVGQPPGIEIGVPDMPSLKAKKLSKLPREKVLLER